MKKKQGVSFYIGVALLVSFVIWTVLVRTVEVLPIGPCGTSVGFATLNQFVHNLTGTNMVLYTITDWLGLVPFFLALFFAIIGLIQWIKRKRLKMVDRSIIVLGVFYIAVIFVYFFFEYVVINYRPVLIEGRLEASYPSSTTMLVATVMPTAMMQGSERIKNKSIAFVINLVISVFVGFMIVGRVLSGVHWITDIIGGALISSALVLGYRGVIRKQ